MNHESLSAGQGDDVRARLRQLADEAHLEFKAALADNEDLSLDDQAQVLDAVQESVGNADLRSK